MSGDVLVGIKVKPAFHFKKSIAKKYCLVFVSEITIEKVFKGCRFAMCFTFKWTRDLELCLQMILTSGSASDY